MSREICQVGEGHNWFPLYYRLSAGTPFPQNHENVVYQKLKHLDDVIFRVLIFGVRVPLQSMLLPDLKVDNCICGYVFENEGVPINPS